MLSENDLTNMERCLELLHKDPDTLTDDEKEKLIVWLGENSPLDSYLELESWFQAVAETFHPEFRVEERPPLLQRLEEMCEANPPEQTEPSQLLVRLVKRYVLENPSAPDKLKLWLRRLPVIPLDLVLYHEGKEIKEIRLDANNREIEITLTEGGSYDLKTSDRQKTWNRLISLTEMFLSAQDQISLETIGATATSETKHPDFTSWEELILEDRIRISLIRDAESAILRLELPYC